MAAIGWSGDTSLVENEAVEWRMPAAGCILWSDNMVIPKGAPNPGTDSAEHLAGPPGANTSQSSMQSPPSAIAEISVITGVRDLDLSAAAGRVLRTGVA